MLSNQNKLELVVTNDGLIVKVKSYTPPSDKGSPLTEKQVLAQLKKIGVKADIDHKLIHEVVAKAVSGSDITGMTVLKGVMPCKEGTQHLNLRGNPDLPVFKGMIIGSLEKYPKDIPGMDVFNQKVLPEESEHTTELKLGSGCVLNQKTNNVLARGYGQVIKTESGIKVKPLFRISPDKTRITCVIFHADYYNKTITQERVDESLVNMGIEDTIDSKVVQDALEKAKATKTPQIAVVARGKAPIKGKDGYFEPSEAIKPPDIDETDVNVKVDYREQSIFLTVNEGAYLGKVYPSQQGQDGFDVFGKIISAKQGKEAPLKPGKNVEISPEGEITALISGMVVFEGSRISVLNFMTINGDVDYSTGNIHIESGSVEITGSIKESFAVDSPEHILIRENVEEAEVDAGGNVEVNYGVVMKGSGKITAGGNFRCKFAENATIESKDNVVFSSNLNNCKVNCKGSIIANGKGIIMGGVLHAGKTIEVGQIGSDYGIKTEIFVGPKPKNLKKLADEKAKLLKHHGEIKDILLKQSMESKSKGLSADGKRRTRELMDTYNTIQGRIQKMDKLIRDKGISPEDAKSHYVKVKDVVYPGTTINIAGKSLKVLEGLKAVKFFFDPIKNAVACTPLK